MEDDDICRVCGTYCPEGGGIHSMCKDSIDAAVAAERERIKARLRGMDDAAGGRHNYYAHAALVLFEQAQRPASPDCLRQPVQGNQTTHSADCWRWHHECAVAKIERECRQG